tara:strand:- start:861 stop:1235 length:375 start_codon:yes stop_codon:yes gene_type:complete
MANVRDFYTRTEEDPKFREDQVEVYDELEACITQVRMTLLTNKGEVLGESDFGIQVEKYLFDFDLNPYQLSDEANSQINKYVSESKRRKIGVSPYYTEDNRGNKQYVLNINIDGTKSPYSILYD